jgi:succinate dehydrogenase flavin-adding protein (antitoxin of CptAB toxin-antitoxin module)
MWLKALRYRGFYRGCRETDWLIGRFILSDHWVTPEVDRGRLEAFLDEEEPSLYRWILYPETAPDHYRGWPIGAIRRFHGLVP